MIVGNKVVGVGKRVGNIAHRLLLCLNYEIVTQLQKHSEPQINKEGPMFWGEKNVVKKVEISL